MSGEQSPEVSWTLRGFDYALKEIRDQAKASRDAKIKGKPKIKGRLVDRLACAIASVRQAIKLSSRERALRILDQALEEIKANEIKRRKMP